MSEDPYVILGVRPDATNDEIKKAYRRLSRIYHPDANINKPQPERYGAEVKFKEIQAAYNNIMRDREIGTDPYSGYKDFYGYDRTSPEMQTAERYLNSGFFREALNVLNGIGSRSARWYYYSALAHGGLGNNINAMNYARQAMYMEPDNSEYRAYVERLSYPSRSYVKTGTRYGRSRMKTGKVCVSCLIANIICNCCCRQI